MLEAADIHKAFGGLAVLKGIGVAVPAGRTVGLIGPNGAGKTTLFNVLTGFVRPDRGSITFDGVDITRFPPERRARLGIARTFQLVRPFARLSVLENVMVGAFLVESASANARERALAALARVGLENKHAVPATGLTLPDRKRMELARCLATSPRLLLLDEVMCGLNPSEMSSMVELIHSLRVEGMTVVLVEHIIDAVGELADEIIVLASGSILARGAPAEVLRDPEVVTAYLGEAHGVAG